MKLNVRPATSLFIEFQPFLRFYRSCWAVFRVFKFFGSFLEPRRPPSDPALHSRMTALGGAETPFFAAAQRSSEREHRKRRAVLRRAARFTDWGVVRAWPLGKSGFPRSWTPAFRRLHRGRRWNGGPSTSPGLMAPACAPRRRRRPPPWGTSVEVAGGGLSCFLERIPGPVGTGPAGAAPLFRRESQRLRRRFWAHPGGPRDLVGG